MFLLLTVVIIFCTELVGIFWLKGLVHDNADVSVLTVPDCF